jgi:hypothetical protein
MGSFDLLASFFVLFGVVKSLVFVNMLPFQHQQTPSLMFVGSTLGAGTGTQREQQEYG